MLTPAPADEGYLYVYGADASSGCDIRSRPHVGAALLAPLASSRASPLACMAMSCSINATSDSALNLARRPRGPCTRYVLISPMPNSSTTCVHASIRLDDSTRSLLRPLPPMDLDTVCLSGSSQEAPRWHFAQDWSKQHGHCSNENSSEPHDGVVHIATGTFLLECHLTSMDIQNFYGCSVVFGRTISGQ
jgi:hypothetical protein